jgi:hypothetical protein
MFTVYNLCIDLLLKLTRSSIRLVVDALCVLDSYLNFDDDMDTLSTFIYPAYTFNGTGISYNASKEILMLSRELEEYVSHYETGPLDPKYERYIHCGCRVSTGCEELDILFRRMVVLRCLHTGDLIVKRTYDHPVFGNRNGLVSLEELSLDARITIRDFIWLSSVVFRSVLQSWKTQQKRI